MPDLTRAEVIESMGFEWCNRTGNYEDVNDYDRLCRSCHRKYDNARRAASGPTSAHVPRRARR